MCFQDQATFVNRVPYIKLDMWYASSTAPLFVPADNTYMNPPVMHCCFDRSTLDLTHAISPSYFHLLLRSDQLKVSLHAAFTCCSCHSQRATCVSLVDQLWVDKHKPTLGVNMIYRILYLSCTDIRVYVVK